MKQKLICGGFLALCLALCLSLSLGFLLRGPSGAGANETRIGTPALFTAEGTLNLQFPAAAAEYFETRFYLRQELISLRNRLITELFAVSPDESVLLGEDGWLYYGATLADYAGTDPMTARELYMAAKNLALMQEHCAARGANFLFTAAPNKNSLYGGHMPSYVPRADGSNAERLYALLAAQGVNYLDLHRIFGAVAETLYFEHDSHWNSRGAALAADAVNAALGRESDCFSDPFAAQTPHSGDLYEMIYPADFDKECDRVYGKVLTYTYDGPSKADSITLKTQGPGEGRLLCWRDSFGNLLHPFLAESFGEAVFSRATAYDLTAVAAGDSVLVELVERNLRNLTEYAPNMPAPPRRAAADKRSDLTVALTSEGRGRWRGTLPTPPDENADIYIVSDGAAYECFLLSDDRFAAALPENAQPEAVLTAVNGALTAFRIG